VAGWSTRRQVSRRHESLLSRRIRWSGRHSGSRSRRSVRARVISIQRLRLILLHRLSDRLMSWACRSTPFDRRRAYRRPAITVASRLGRTQRRGGLDIGFDEGSPGSIGPGVLVDHAELLPPSCGVPSQAFLSRLGCLESRQSWETLPALGVSRSFPSAEWVNIKGLCPPYCHPDEPPQTSRSRRLRPEKSMLGQSHGRLSRRRPAGRSSPVLVGY
jgi:hypothetical protein